jgi:hypothetical protein
MALVRRVIDFADSHSLLDIASPCEAIQGDRTGPRDAALDRHAAQERPAMTKVDDGKIRD